MLDALTRGHGLQSRHLVSEKIQSWQNCIAFPPIRKFCGCDKNNFLTGKKFSLSERARCSQIFLDGSRGTPSITNRGDYMKGISTLKGLGQMALLFGALVSGVAASARGVQKVHKPVPFFLAKTAAGIGQTTGDVLYYGGPVIPSVKIVSVFWTNQVDSTLQSGIGNFYSTLSNSTYIDWLSEYNTNIKAQDGTQGTNQTISRGSYAGAVTITPEKATNPTTIDDTDIQAELLAQISKGTLPAPDANTLYIFHFPPNLQITLEQGGQSAASCQDFCAYHGATTNSTGMQIPYAVLPDMGGNCSFGCGASTNKFDISTNVVSHEIMEAITDPFVMLDTSQQAAAPLAWYDLNNGEIGDICQDTAGKITGSNGTAYVVQGGWSQVKNQCLTTF